MPHFEDLSYKGQDPGAVRFGNFINYYTFHSANQRLENLHSSMFPFAEGDLLCLDIGCNTGELSKELYQYLKKYIYPNNEIHVLGIDIDPVLIKRAQETDTCNIKFMVLDIMNPQDQNTIKQYLNLYKKKIFDIIFCFSVTMWLHLNNGDDKFLEFLKYMGSLSKAIIIEPQPWECYRNAQKRMKKSGYHFPLYETLTIKRNMETVIENVLSENGHKKIYESPESLWKRKILSFHLQK